VDILYRMAAYYPVQLWTGNNYTGDTVRLQYSGIYPVNSLNKLGLANSAVISSLVVAAYTEVIFYEFENRLGRRNHINGPAEIPDLSTYFKTTWFKPTSMIIKRIIPNLLDKMNCCQGFTPAGLCADYTVGSWRCNNSIKNYCADDKQSLQICKEWRCRKTPEDSTCVNYIDDPDTYSLTKFTTANTRGMIIFLFIWFIVLINIRYFYTEKYSSSR